MTADWSIGPPETGDATRFAGPADRSSSGRLSSRSWATGGVLPRVFLPRDGPPELPCRAASAKWPPDRGSAQKNAFQLPLLGLDHLNHQPTSTCPSTNVARMWTHLFARGITLRPPVPAPHGRRFCLGNPRFYAYLGTFAGNSPVELWRPAQPPCSICCPRPSRP